MNVFHKMAIALAFSFAIAEISLEFLASGTHIGWDFRLRRNEAECVLDGIDPYKVWSGQEETTDYVGYNRPEQRKNSAQKGVNGYPPWEYLLMFPFTLASETSAWKFYRIAMFLGAIGCMACGFKYGYKTAGRLDMAFLCAATATFSGIAVGNEFATGNYGVFLALSLFALVWSLDRNHHCVGSLALAFCMVKPQIGFLPVISLLIGKRYRVVFGAAALCLLASIPASVMLKESPLTLILQIPKYGSDVAKGSLLIPGPLFAGICKYSGQLPLVAVNAAIGIVVTLYLSLQLRESNNWFLKLTPAILMGSAWTYSSLHDRWVYAIPLVVFTVAAESDVNERVRNMARIAIVGMASTALLYFHPGYGGTWWDKVGLTVFRSSLSRQILTGIVSMTSFVGVFFGCYVCLKLQHCTGRRCDE